MIYPLQRPVQPVFNSAAAIRNTLALGFDGDSKEAWKPLSVKRPHCSHTHTHICHIHKHTRNSDTEVCKAPHSKECYQKHFILSLYIFFSPALSDRQTDSSLCSLHFLERPTPPPKKKKKKKAFIYNYSLKESWIRTELSALSELMVCRKLWIDRWRMEERKRQGNSQQVSRIINLSYLSSSLDSRCSTAPNLHFVPW